MTNAFWDDEPSGNGNAAPFTVTEISASIKRTIDSSFEFVRVRGEISGYKKAPSGHAYLQLKDEGAVLAAVCWKGVSGRLSFTPEDGVEVIATGRITTYPGNSRYQLVIEQMEPAGIGALMAQLEKRKKKLAKEGLFDANRKQAIPCFPTVIGVVTSPTGAVIKDILHRIEERFPLHVLLWPVLVQGPDAAKQIAVALRGFNKLTHDDSTPYARPDVIIVARGGGSVEDLWAFNEEIVVREASESTIPIISAVGHETDVTLIDYVADLRAPTPTAAAEMATPVLAEWLHTVQQLHSRMNTNIRHYLKYRRECLSGLVRALPKPEQLLDNKVQRFDHAVTRFNAALPQMIERKKAHLDNGAVRLLPPTHKIQMLQLHASNMTQTMHGLIEIKIEQLQQRLSLAAKLLESYHYKHTLKRGFALVKHDASIVKSAGSLKAGDHVTIEFYDDSVGALIHE